MNAHRSLEVWQRAHALAIRVHRLTGGDTLDRNPILVNQIRRSTESIPDNIAEGRAGRTDGIYLRHLGIAYASVAEADSQVTRLVDYTEWSPELGFEAREELATIRRQLLALELSVKARQKSPRRPRARKSPRR